jgi:hypothetical protein
MTTPRQISVRVVDDGNPDVAHLSARHVNLALTPADVSETTELSTYMAGYTPPGRRADDVSPIVLVDNDEFQYRSFSINDSFKPVHVKGSLQGPIPEVDPSTSMQTARVQERYLGSFIPWQTENQGNRRWDVRMAASRRIRNAIELDRELDVWTMLTTSGNWNAAQVYALGVGMNWNGGASGNPILDLQRLNEGSIQTTMDFWMNDIVAGNFLRHDAVRDHIRFFAGDANALNNALGAIGGAGARNAAAVDLLIPGVGTIHVVASRYLDANSVMQRVLGSNFVVGTSNPGAGIPTTGEDIGTTFTFRRKGPSGNGFTTREFRVEGRGPYGGTMLVAAMADVALMIANNVGGLITGVTA